MALNFIEMGTRVEVISSASNPPYVTTVAAVMEDGRVLLDIMRLGGEEKRLDPKLQYILRFFTERGIIKFPAVMRGYVKKGNYDYMFFQTSGTAEKIQRRQAFRLSCGIDVDFLVLSDTEEVAENQGFLRDISSGGVRLLTKNKLDEGQLLQLKLPMIKPDFNLYAMILSIKEISEAKYLWQYGVEFVGTSEADEEKIVMYVHNEQHKARSRK
ncbi:MAG: flagellar brake protein [Defluviitaleaceae bacterium]|nr:flagellar brake protein [Defluviitaleaceae bacterium]